jgi:hypothetical protein
VKTLSSTFILLCAGLGAFAQESPKARASSATPLPQQLRILSQPDAPLRIVSADVTWAMPNDTRGVQIYIVVENVSQLVIRTYATRRDLDATAKSKACLGPPGMIGRGLRPGQRTGTSTWQGTSNSDPPLAVWIDFVELSDGTRWGADECQIAEWRDGERDGARAQRDQLLVIFREKGADVLMVFIKEKTEVNRRALERGERPIFPIVPPGHSKRWEEGFSAGARGIVQQVIDAERDWGADEIEHVLLRPIDPSEKKSP